MGNHMIKEEYCEHKNYRDECEECEIKHLRRTNAKLKTERELLTTALQQAAEALRGCKPAAEARAIAALDKLNQEPCTAPFCYCSPCNQRWKNSMGNPY